MGAALPETAPSRLFLSGNEAVALAVRDAGCRVAAAYPGTPSTEILEEVSRFPDLYTEWSVNEKVSLEVALGASMVGARAFCAMKHVGLNVAADALMTMTVTGTDISNDRAAMPIQGRASVSIKRSMMRLQT